MNHIWIDLRCAVRSFARWPGLTFIAILALALGISASTIVFTLVAGVVIHPLPYPEPDRLVALRALEMGEISHLLGPPSLALVRFWRAKATSFESIAAQQRENFTLSEEGGLESRGDHVIGVRASSEIFSVLRIEPFRGRVFRAEDCRPEAPRVVVLSHGLWRSRYGADPAVIGQTIRLNREGHTVIGVLPPHARIIDPQDRDLRLWVPLGSETEEQQQVFTVARLRDGVLLSEARAELGALAWRGSAGESDLIYHGLPVLLGRLGSHRAILAFQAAVACLLLIACVNVAHLLLAKGETRRHELATRAVLGAGPGRLARQLLTESLLLGLTGGALGLLLTLWGFDALVASLPSDLHYLDRFLSLDGQVLWIALAFSLLTSALFGTLPALQGAKTNLLNAVQPRMSAVGAPRRRRHLQWLLVATEVALALAPMILAAQLLTAFLRLHDADLGFETKGLLTVALWPIQGGEESSESEKEKRDAAARQMMLAPPLLEDLRPADDDAAPLVLTMASGSAPIYGDYLFATPEAEGQPISAEEPAQALSVLSVMPGYFRHLGMTVRGRGFLETGQQSSEPVIVVNETLARRYWPEQNPLGQRLRLGCPDTEILCGKWLRVVGVTTDVHDKGLRWDTYRIYAPFPQRPSPQAYLVLRSTGNRRALAEELETRLQALALRLGPGEIRTLESDLGGMLVGPRFYTLLMILVATIALVLTSVGIYGVVAYSMSLRTREIGLRMAIGARLGNISRQLVMREMIPVGVGITCGVVAALNLFPKMAAAFFYGWKLHEPMAAIAIAILVALITLLAIWLPARRAARVDPMIALRQE